jgi:ribosomal protein S18 acetylase RimI-like enzyme
VYILGAMINYLDSCETIKPTMLEGFFVGWRTPLSTETHLQVLRNSDYIVLAFDRQQNKVIGFITALSDGVQVAFIPLLEVLPNHQGQGIGSELLKRMLAKVSHLPAIDLTCDPELQSFYKRFSMMPSVGMILRNY